MPDDQTWWQMLGAGGVGGVVTGVGIAMRQWWAGRNEARMIEGDTTRTQLEALMAQNERLQLERAEQIEQLRADVKLYRDRAEKGARLLQRRYSALELRYASLDKLAAETRHHFEGERGRTARALGLLVEHLEELGAVDGHVTHLLEILRSPGHKIPSRREVDELLDQAAPLPTADDAPSGVGGE